MNRSRRPIWTVFALAAVLALPGASPAEAQLLPSGGGPLGLPSVRLPDLPAGPGRLKGEVDRLAGDTLSRARAMAAAALIRDHPQFVEADERGAPVVRGRIMTLAPTPEALAALRQAGFEVLESEAEPLDLGLVILRPPAGMSAREAVRRARRIAPQGRYDYDHIYQEAGLADTPLTPAGATAAGVRIGLVDGGVDAASPALAGARIEQRGFAPGGVRPRAHGLAIAALLAGEQGRFKGAAPGAQLLVADVYGATPAGGSASAISRALGWMAAQKVGVVNISLVGPPNLVLEAAVRALTARGHLVVAAVGNDGPAAPALYPAAYQGVIAVTAVDARRRLLPEAGRPPRIDFAAPGADMAVPAAPGGFVGVRGTSFAAPIVAGALARDLPAPDPARAAVALARLAGRAEDLGPKGPDRLYGQGLVGFDLAVPPASVAARGLLTQP